jgi:K+-transporting ATPase ATPase C chain
MDLGRQLRTSVLAMLVFTFLTGIAYPVVMTAIAQVAFPSQANGSLLRSADGTAVGSSLLGQGFDDPKYFHPRPSAAGADGYDASASSGSNLGPTNQKLLDAVAERAKAYRDENGLPTDALVPIDAVTTSASGLDPDITLANAYLQVARVAKARGMSDPEVRAVIDRVASRPVLGFFGTPSVNVLHLNLTLDGWSGL